MAKNLDELRKENPELAAAVESEIKASAAKEGQSAADEAVKTAMEKERKRLAEIDELSALFPADVVDDAKDKNPCSAEEMCYRAAVEAKKTGAAFMKNLKEDNQNSGAQSVPGASAPQNIPGAPKTEAEKYAEAEKAVHAFFSGEQEGK